jgi:hypothetical protein
MRRVFISILSSLMLQGGILCFFLIANHYRWSWLEHLNFLVPIIAPGLVLVWSPEDRHGHPPDFYNWLRVGSSLILSIIIHASVIYLLLVWHGRARRRPFF